MNTNFKYHAAVLVACLSLTVMLLYSGMIGFIQQKRFAEALESSGAFGNVGTTVAVFLPALMIVVAIMLPVERIRIVSLAACTILLAALSSTQVYVSTAGTSRMAVAIWPGQTGYSDNALVILSIFSAVSLLSLIILIRTKERPQELQK